jgi:hypothetical protein
MPYGLGTLRLRAPTPNTGCSSPLVLLLVRSSIPYISDPAINVVLVIVVDNHRVLHGRSAFDGKRRMCGAYIGIDEYRSKLTVLQEKFAAPEMQTVQPGARPTPNTSQRSVWHTAL